MSDSESFDAEAASFAESPAEVQSAAQAALPGKANAEGWRHLHPLSPVLRGGLFFLIIVGVIIANLRDRLIAVFVGGPDTEGMAEGGDVISLIEFLSKGGLLIFAIGALLLLVALIVGLSWIAWRFQTYRVTAEAVESRSGVFFKQHRRAPLDRVQSVNLQRSLLARAVGLTKVEILTAGIGGKVELAYLGFRDAKTAREQILRLAAVRRVGQASELIIDEITVPAPVSSEGSAPAPARDMFTELAHDFIDLDVDPEAAANRALVRVPVGRLLASILLNWETIFLIALLLAAFGIAVGGTALAALFGNGEGAAVGFGVLFAIIPLALVFVGIMFSQFNKGFNFTLSRGRDSVRIGAGLTSTVTDSIPFGRIHAIEARQPLLWKKFGWWKVRVTLAGHTVSQGGQNTLQNVVLPVGSQDEVVRVIEALAPGTTTNIADGLADTGGGYIEAGPRAGWVLWFGKRRAGIRIDEPVAPGEAVSGDVASAETASSAGLTLARDSGDVALSVAATPAIGPSSATLRIRRGFLTRSLSIMPIVRAQSIQLYRPLVHRMVGLASVQAHTVLGPVRMEMRGLELEEARRLFDELAETVLRVQGADSEQRSR